ncbi:hypothetical protein O3G_MSEX014049 [Manduca sexta]|uniref:DUF7869 domain-containing protein n=1 Tax=Manduca sexta TaxID=7130 RepID=A0A921ZST8_MANSE|nr:hypothetical protein O3G_MSEX014049 [Manduca sexta]KAG6463740.1 hypothetical protein O3G_MSEX014049 [Manduca sexta]
MHLLIMNVFIGEMVSSNDIMSNEPSASTSNDSEKDRIILYSTFETDPICDKVVKLRKPNRLDYEMLGMTVPDNLCPDFNVNNRDDKQTNDDDISVQCDEVIDTDIAGKTSSSPTIFQIMNENNYINEGYGTGIVQDYIDFDKENEEPNNRIVDSDATKDFSAGSDDEYMPPAKTARCSISSSSSTSPAPINSKRGKKRERNEKNWKQNVRKTLKNLGKDYDSKKGDKKEAKRIKSPCSRCKFSCTDKFTNDDRQQIFETYWALGSLQRQRDFLSTCVTIQDITCRRLKNPAKPRNKNSWFSFVKQGQTKRICKTFLLNTLGIGQRTLRTVIEAKSTNSGIPPSDQRGRHGKHQKTSPEVVESVRQHINTVPRVESHYLRANTSREFIDGGLTLAALHRDYENKRKAADKEVATLYMYSQIFNTEFNISFFIPKKDSCNFCESYKHATSDKKIELEQRYRDHLKEKALSRTEKAKDIEISRTPGSNLIVAIYDLQAQLPVPIGNSSAFYYKSKLNCYNFTVTNTKNKSTSCYFWYESLGSKGSTEIGTCVYKFLEQIAEEYPGSDVIFYSDNCCGQQKNRYVFNMYHYAVEKLEITSVCHKFLISGHSQNEGDNAHSLIEKAIKRAKKSGGIYVPDQYINLIRGAKIKGKPFTVQEMHWNSFYDLKFLAEELNVNFSKNIHGEPIKLTELTMIKFTKNSDKYKYKMSFEQDWLEAKLKLTRGRKKTPSNINLRSAYNSKISISETKKNGLLQLLRSNIIPNYYEYFFNNL